VVDGIKKAVTDFDASVLKEIPDEIKSLVNPYLDLMCRPFDPRTARYGIEGNLSLCHHDCHDSGVKVRKLK
jgi:hypothetical protein